MINCNSKSWKFGLKSDMDNQTQESQSNEENWKGVN